MKKAIVVGASSGIGRELALRLAGEGYTVGATGRRGELLEELKAESGGRVSPAVFDASSEEAEEELERLIDGLGGMDLFVFCAGTGDFNPGLEYALEEATNKINVDAFTCAVDFAYRYFAANGGGHLAAVTSVMGLRGSGVAPAYAASKAYQINYMEGLRQRSVKEKAGITVTDLRPGSVETNMMKGDGHFWISQPADAARTIMNAVKCRKPVAYVTPRWQVLGTLLKGLPRGIYKKM